MKNVLSLVAAMTIGLGALVGCDDTVEQKREVDVKDNGTVVEKNTKVEEKADGTIQKTEEKKVDRPNLVTHSVHGRLPWAFSARALIRSKAWVAPGCPYSERAGWRGEMRGDAAE